MSKSTRKSRSESLSAASKRAATEWNERLGVVADPKRAIKKEIKALQILLNKAGAELGRAVRQEGDVQSAYDRRATLLKKRSTLVKKLYA